MIIDHKATVGHWTVPDLMITLAVTDEGAAPWLAKVI
jgi:hypothetical protein